MWIKHRWLVTVCGNMQFYLHFTIHTLFQSLSPVQQFSGQNPAVDSKATQTRLHCSQVVVIAIVLYGRHYDLVGRNEISISQITTDLLLFTRIFLSPITAKSFTGLDWIWITRPSVFNKKQELLILHKHLSSSLFFWWGPWCYVSALCHVPSVVCVSWVCPGFKYWGIHISKWEQVGDQINRI